MKIAYAIVLFGSLVLAQLEDGFVDLASIDPTIEVEMRYVSEWNFIGRKIKGYQANKCLLTKEAATALSKVQKDLNAKGYSLLMFDCYRPQKAVNEFHAWTREANDLKMQKIFYPDIPKNKLIELDYIADKSSHTRGSTVDLTVIKKMKKQNPRSDGKLRFQEQMLDCRAQRNVVATGQLDMGTIFDCFNVLANTNHPKVPNLAKQNRQILKTTMEAHGFVNFPKEWWHYTLKNEPFKEKTFDFDIR